MALIRLVDTTTPLRVANTHQDDFFRIIDPTFKTAIERQSRDRYVDVQMEGRGIKTLARGLSRQRPGIIPDTDFLGVYFSHPLPSHHFMINVYPVRILAACDQWNKILGGALPFANRYPALLHGVIIHELAHFLMDDQPSVGRCRPVVLRQFIRDIRADTTSDFPAINEQSLPDGDCEQWIQRRLASNEHICTMKPTLRNRLINQHPIVLRQLKQRRRIIEESLANAFILKQAFGKRRLAALRTFVESQSAAYRAGLRWGGDIAQLLGTAASWRRFKAEDIGIDGRNWVTARPGRREILTGLVRRLLTPGESIDSFDFQKEP